MLKRFFTMFMARNKEFFRDRSSLGWNFLFPVLIIIGFNFMFKGGDKNHYKVGLYVGQNTEQQDRQQYLENSELKSLAHFDLLKLVYFNDMKMAIDKMKHHKVDFLIDAEKKNYYYIDSSPRGKIAEQIFKGLMLGSEITKYQKETVVGREISYVEWLFPGILAMNMMFSALFGVGYVVVRYRKNGVLRRLKTTPLTSFEYICSQIFSRIFILLFSTIIIYAGCSYLLDLNCYGSYFDLLIVYSLGALSLISLGLLVASRGSSEELAGGLLNLMSWPMMFLSEVWFSMEGAVPWAKFLSNLLPLTHMIKAARAIMNDGKTLLELMPHIYVMVGMIICFMMIGSFLFSWEKE